MAWSTKRHTHRRGSAALAALLLIGLATPAAAGTLAERVFETTLANGLKVLILEEPKAPVASAQVWYKVGARNEPAGKTGLAHMMEHMMFKGTPTVSGKEYEARIQRHGGMNNAHTGMDVTAYYVDFAAERIGLGLELEADRMAHLSIAEQDFQTERAVVAEERRLRVDDQPAQILGEVLRATAFLAHPYGRPTIGWSSDIQGWTRDDVAAFYRTYYAPNNATLVVAGAVKRDELLPRIRALFERIPRQPAPPPVVTREPPQQGERRVLVRKEAELPLLLVAYHAPNITHPDSYALSALAIILGGGESARLHRQVVYETPLASYAVAGYNPAHPDPFLFGLSAGPLPGKTAEEVERALDTEVERIQREGVTERELMKAKNQMESEFIFSQDSVHGLASLLGHYETVASWRLLDSFLDGVRTVTADDVLRVARTYLVPDNRTVGVLVPVTPQREKVPAAPARPDVRGEPTELPVKGGCQ
ncbi:MAG: pitrilysin family protein [Candidatus Methylomirabilota bacterium]